MAELSADEPKKVAAADPGEALAVAYIASGAHGVSMDLKLSDEEIRVVVARAIRVWREIQRQLKE